MSVSDKTVIVCLCFFLFAASNLIPSAYESAKACAVVVDDNTAPEGGGGVSDDQLALSHHVNGGAASPAPPPPPASSSVPRNLPPDGTSFKQISLSSSRTHEAAIPAYGYWNVQFYQGDAGYVDFRLEVPRGASLGLYARKNALPTHTNYDIMEVVKGFESKDGARAKVKRAIKVNKTSSSRGKKDGNLSESWQIGKGASTFPLVPGKPAIIEENKLAFEIPQRGSRPQSRRRRRRRRPADHT